MPMREDERLDARWLEVERRAEVQNVVRGVCHGVLCPMCVKRLCGRCVTAAAWCMVGISAV